MTMRLCFDLEPSDDPELTCYICGGKNVTHEFTFQGGLGLGETRTVGIHRACATKYILHFEKSVLEGAYWTFA